LSKIRYDIIDRIEDSIILKNTDRMNYTLQDLEEGKIYFWTVIPNDGITSGTCKDGLKSFRVNSRPLFSPIADQKVKAGSEIQLEIPVSDSDPEDSISYELIEKPWGMVLNTNSAKLMWKPGKNQTGINHVTIRISDGYESNEVTFIIQVSKEGSSNSRILIASISATFILIFILLVVILLIIRKKNSNKVDTEETTSLPEKEIPPQEFKESIQDMINSLRETDINMNSNEDDRK